MSSTMTDAPPAAQPLAIVVPAWKAAFLQQALASIAAQTDPRYVCHVFDDAGDPAVARICAQFPQFHYSRFDTNLGGTSLVAHWNRCLARVPEPWVWLFSDDDVMAPECVAAFHAVQKQRPACRVFQFAVDMVSSDLASVWWRSIPPAWECAADFVAARLAGRRLSCLPDHVFHWPTLRDGLGGFIDFPLAWNADDAAWAWLGRQHGMGGVPQAKVLWRQSEHNISNAAHGRWSKLGADIAYLQWLKKQALLPPATRRLAEVWLGARLVRLYAFSGAEWPRVARRVAWTHWRALAIAGWLVARRGVAKGICGLWRRVGRSR